MSHTSTTLRRRILSRASLAALMLGCSDAASWAQQNIAAVEEITVTARRREEKLSEVPEAITALSSADIVSRNITELKDIATLTPSLTLTQYGTQRVNRTNQTLLVRGVTSRVAGTVGTGVFINGAPASNGGAGDLADLERVEVLKGPQSAYFGRATFAGAINLVTKAPSETWGGSVEGIIGSYSQHDLKGSVEGPIVPGILGVRVSGRFFEQDGQYKSAWDGQNLTDQRTKVLSTVLDFHPTDDLKITWVGLARYLHDGYPSYAKFTLSRGDFNCNAGAAPAGARNYICGELPRFPENRIGANFPITPAIFNYLYNNSGNIPNPFGVQLIGKGPGDIGHNYHTSLRGDYTLHGGFLEGATISYLGSYNYSHGQTTTNSAAETLLTVNPNPTNNPTVPPNPALLRVTISETEDLYQEARLSSSGSQRFRWMFGGSYYRTYPRVTPLAGIQLTGAANFSGTTYTNLSNWGMFGSLAYDLTDALTASFEARYQGEKQSIKNLAGVEQIASSVNNFMPRASLQYKFTPDLNAYASWARGINPQSFNTSLFTVPQVVVDSIVSQTGAGKIVKGERIDMFELGLKGNLLDGRIAFDADVYYGFWKDQVITQRVIGPNPNDVTQQTILTVSTNLGESRLKGLELNVGANLTEHLKTNVTFALTGTEIKSYYCAACLLNITGSPNVVGNKFPGVPQKTATVFLEYSNELGTMLGGDANWYVNGQYIYADKMFADETNLAWTPQRHTFDFRVGINRGNLTVEGFVLNAFNAYYYTVGQRDVEQINVPTATQNNAFYLGLPDKRRFGARARYKF